MCILDVEDVASIATEPSIDPGQGMAGGRGLGMGRGRGRSQGMGPGHGQGIDSGFGQGGLSRLPLGLPEGEGESDGMFEDCYARVYFQLKQSIDKLE